MTFGVDILLENPSPLRGMRIGLLVNTASVTSRYVPTARALLSAGLDVRILFGPEHGFTGAAQDMEAVTSPEPSRLPVISLYGTSFEELSPKPEHLDGLDVVVSDLPDVGSRYYTFVWTTALMMRACAARGIPVWVLDRPNPIGRAVQGNVPDVQRLLSFVGLYPIPVRHGMTPAEIARYVNDRFGLGCELHVASCRRPASRAEEAWVLPSPNMPTRDTALVYPGGCLYEGTNLSEGRGTTRPFEVVGAPWLDADHAADALNALGLAGAVFRPHTFKPTFQKHAGRLCGGVQLHVTDCDAFRPYEAGLQVVKTLRDLDPASFRWRTETYEYRDDVPAIDLLTGTHHYRELVDAGAPLDEWIATFEDDVARFLPIRERYRLYPDRPAVFQIVGAHESGKTTLAVAVIAALVSKGHRVASVKHTAHEYETDAPGKDSRRHGEAGANPAVLVAGGRTAVHRVGTRPALRDVLPDADVVIVEGYKSERFPKIEVVRAATGRAPVCLDDPALLAVVTDVETAHAPGVPRFRFDEIERVVALVEELIR